MRTRSLFCVTSLAAALLAVPGTALAAPGNGCGNRETAWVYLYAKENFQNQVNGSYLCPATSHVDLLNGSAHDHVRSWAVSGPIPQNGGKHMTVCLLDYVGSQRVVLSRLTTGGPDNVASQRNLGDNSDRADAIELC
jgi:hypothetical protein